MNENEQAAYVIGMAAGGVIEALGMLAENQQRFGIGASPAYDMNHFYQMMLDRGLHHNALVTTLGGG